MPMHGWPYLTALSAGALLVIVGGFTPTTAFADEVAGTRRIDPADWGSDHVGKPMPPYVTGDECLFCHRETGPSWPANRHQLTIRPAAPDAPAIKELRRRDDGKGFADETRYVMGSRRITRFLKRSPAYGKLELLTSSLVAPDSLSEEEDVVNTPKPHAQPLNAPAQAGHWKDFGDLHWDKTTFGDRCAGCHATGVSTQTRAFSAVSLDCYTCHGDVNLEHTKDIRHVLLSSENQVPRQIVSVCGQCHLRGGKSKSSGLPYPNTFVAGDNLFRDFQVDLAAEAIQAMPMVEQHVYLNTRDVAVLGQLTVTCLSCHDVHGQSSQRHQELEDAAICTTCHVPNSENTELLSTFLKSLGPQAHNAVCDY